MVHQVIKEKEDFQDLEVKKGYMEIGVQKVLLVKREKEAKKEDRR